MTLTMKLPYPPSINKYWRWFRGRMMLSRAGREYKANAKLMAIGSRPAEMAAMRVPVAVTVLACPPAIRRRRDLDNVLKALFDALKGVVYEDDSLIHKIAAQWGPAGGSGHVVITVEPMEGECSGPNKSVEYAASLGTT